MAATTVPCLSSVTRTMTRIVPRIVSRALGATSGITSLMGNGGPSRRAPVDLGSISAGFVSALSATGFGSGSLLTAAALGAGTGAGELAAGAGVGSVLKILTPTQISSTATAPAISSSAPLLKRRRAGAGGVPLGSLMRITSRRADGVPDWDSVVDGTSGQSPATGRMKCTKAVVILDLIRARNQRLTDSSHVQEGRRCHRSCMT